MNIIKQSKQLSYILRHSPESAGIQLNVEGFADTKALCAYMNIDFKLLEEIVRGNNKKRFKFNHDKSMIKANQGHSVNINLKLEACEPPEYLYHGTASRFISSIEASGLKKMNRHHVHLSDNLSTAASVGKRHGKLVLLKIDTKKMYENGTKFYKTDNGVWLTTAVPYEFVRIL